MHFKQLCLMLIYTFSLQTHTSYADSIESVIGDDTRVQIQKGDQRHIYNKIGMLYIGDYRCTGTLIGPQTVLTAAHCLIPLATDKNLKATDILFVPGKRLAGHAPFGVFRAKNAVVHSSYTNPDAFEYDIALLELKESPKLGYLPVKVSSKLDLLGSGLTIAGYPGDKASGTLWEGKGSVLWTPFFSNTLDHSADTFSGQSGAAVRTSFNGVEVIVGVHTGGNPKYNIATRFNDEIAKELIKMKQILNKNN